MLQRLVAAGWEPPASLRFALLGGAPCPPPLLQAALDRGIPVAPTYGMTETCSQVATMLPGEVESHFGSAGRALPGVELRITGDERVAVRGPMVSPVVVGPDGWLVTNDLGVIDSEGFLTVLGRADEAIVTGGEKVVPRRVEQLLLEDPAVSEAAVVGLADPEWGERVVAAVTARPGATPDPEILRGLVRERLAPHMVPKSVVVLDAMPHAGPGKVDRPALRRLLEEAAR
jgi:O-succinylbenzoic acid--CoA ligase